MNERSFFAVNSDLLKAGSSCPDEFQPVIVAIRSCQEKIADSQKGYCDDIEYLKLVCLQHAKRLSHHEGKYVLHEVMDEFDKPELRESLKIVGCNLELEVDLRLRGVSDALDAQSATSKLSKGAQRKLVAKSLEEIYKALDRGQNAFILDVSSIGLRLDAIMTSIQHGFMTFETAVARLGEVLSSNYLVSVFPDEMLAYMRQILRDNSAKVDLVGDYRLSVEPSEVSQIISIPEGWLAVSAQVFTAKTPDKSLLARLKDTNGTLSDWFNVGTSWRSLDIFSSEAKIGSVVRELQFMVPAGTAAAFFAMAPGAITASNLEEVIPAPTGDALWLDSGGHYSSEGN